MIRYGAIMGGAIGLALAAWLLASYGVGTIMALLAQAGWGIAAVVAFHFVQIGFSAAAWRAITAPSPALPPWPRFVQLRWLREGINNLLPVAQIGGEFVVVRLMRRQGMRLADAAAGTIADLTMEMLTQIAFTLTGLACLLAVIGQAPFVGTIVGGVAFALAVAAAFVGAQWFGLGRLIERVLMRLGQALQWSSMHEIDGLHEALRARYRSPGRLALAATHHMVSWLLGAVEVCLALHFLGHEVGLAAGCAIEALGQALKAAGFAVPGAIGVSEGGFVVVGQLFGIAPEVSIALALVKRIREVALGAPALLAWQMLERSTAARARLAPESVS